MKWQDAIPWIIAVIGWFAAHAFSEARERRKDAKAQIEKILEKLSNIEKLGISFHTNEVHDPAKARELTSEIQKLERSLNRIQILDFQSLKYPIIAFRKSITLNNFDAGSFLKQTDTSNLIQEICDATFDLEDEIDTQYQEHYPSTFPYFKWPGFLNFLIVWR